MKPNEVLEVLKNPDIKILWLCESGSKIFGWHGKDSDSDIRGFYVDPLFKTLSINHSKDNYVYHPKGDIIDIQIFELKKFMIHLTQPNFNMMEWVFSQIVYHGEELREELTGIATRAISSRIGDHARGWSYSMYKMNWDDPKKCLMALRPMMVYINLLETNTWESDIMKLGDGYFKKMGPLLSELLTHRRAGHKTPDRLKTETADQYDMLKRLSRIKEVEHTIQTHTPQTVIERANLFINEQRMKFERETNKLEST